MEIIKKSSSFRLVVKLDMDEIRGLCKMIGPTSQDSRIDNFGMSTDQSIKMSKMFFALSKVLDEESDD